MFFGVFFGFECGEWMGGMEGVEKNICGDVDLGYFCLMFVVRGLRDGFLNKENIMKFMFIMCVIDEVVVVYIEMLFE